MEGEELENQSQLQSCSQKYSLQLGMVFFALRPKKFSTFFLLISLQWSYKILSMSLKIWSCASGYPRGLSIFWDPCRFSWPLGKIHFWKRVWKNGQILPQIPWSPPKGPYIKRPRINIENRATSAYPKMGGLRPPKNRSAPTILDSEKSPFYATPSQRTSFFKKNTIFY